VPEHPPRGWFITVEGPDGAGKTLVTERLRDALQSRGFDVVVTREPGGTLVGERVRSVVLDHAPGDPAHDPRTDALLFSAGRAQLVAEVIRPALAQGRLVLATRHADSTLAYQGYGAGLPLAGLRELQGFATGGLHPDLTILLDVPADVGLARKQDDEQNRFEVTYDLAFHRRVRDGYLALAAAEPGRFHVIDASQAVEAVTAAALAAILVRVDTPSEPRAGLSRIPG
jgi:dTMP kinase